MLIKTREKNLDFLPFLPLLDFPNAVVVVMLSVVQGAPEGGLVGGLHGGGGSGLVGGGHLGGGGGGPRRMDSIKVDSRVTPPPEPETKPDAVADEVVGTCDPLERGFGARR